MMVSNALRPYRGRFAPTPSGALHFGSLVAALGSWLRARSCAGTWLIRIEDLDPPREVPGATESILETLSAFGMESDEPVVLQSSRTDNYTEALEKLRILGLAFPCWCSRSDLQVAGLHRGSCVAAPSITRNPAWRVRVDDQSIAFQDVVYGAVTQSLTEEVGDFVIRRIEGYFAYQLAVVVDDGAQGISEVVRGVDLLSSTPRQIWLQRALQLQTPDYLHLPLVLDADGRKLSKQTRSLPVDRDDPLPALRSALRFLGYPTAGIDGPRDVPALLRRAIEFFNIAAIPQSVIPSAEHEMQ
ncbi:MAG: tRNA glutamyl-Q(34) synthetase GluQRS [Tahibacter sp.]